MRVDVLVAGGGPVGLAAAIEARLAGLTVAVVEPRSAPIDKACGEGLMPGALPLLARLGVDPDGHPIRGIGYRSGRLRVDHRFERGAGRGVRREVLHAALAERAEAVGAQFVQGRIETVEQRNGRVVAAGIESDWLLGCDGLHSRIARLTGLALPARGARRRYGIRQHFRIAPWTDLVEVHFAAQADFYVTPVAADTVGVAMLGGRTVDYDTALAGVPELAERLAGAHAIDDRRGAGPFGQRTRARVHGRVLLVGDASGYVDALTGEGLRVGFDQARAAIAAVLDGEPDGYEKRWREVTRDFRILTSGLVAWASSPARGLLVPSAVRMPRLYGRVVERLAR